jgi:hypothetical protein
LSAGSSRPFGWPRAWASRETFASGRNFCGPAIEDPYGRSGLLCSGGVGQVECVKSTGPIAPPARRVLCVVLRLAYYPLPIPGGLLPRRNLRRLSGIFPHVADREPLDLNSLLRLLRSHLECIRFRPTRQVVSWRIGSPRYLTPRAWPQLARLQHLPTLLQTVALPTPSGAFLGYPGANRRRRGGRLPIPVPS